VFASTIGFVFILPVGIIEAVAGAGIPLNVISELVGGFVVPGKAISMNMFKAYGCMVLLAALKFCGDLKLGHYSKVPPRAMFRVQLISTAASVIVVLPSSHEAINSSPLV
jgi:OPT oligopeptide transporter protein